MVSVRVTFNGNLFHPAEGMFGKVLPTYYPVIAWDMTEHLLARKYFIVVQLQSSLFSR